MVVYGILNSSYCWQKQKTQTSKTTQNTCFLKKYMNFCFVAAVIIDFAFQLISQNQERFVQMLNDPLDETPEGPQQGAGGGAPMGAGGYIQVTPQEKEAIERVSTYNWNMTVYLKKKLFAFVYKT